MTLIIDNLFIKIDKVYSDKYGDKWLEIIGFNKYFKIRDKYELLDKEDKKSFDNGELVF